ncbi:MAG: hypothetical protein Ct9H90mP2_11700 [Dehalococcoidia bacterium]|nr:MAG: hypothetical protein Ct9H90mP2_11700 [Dehalococcoidia bacterium]
MKEFHFQDFLLLDKSSCWFCWIAGKQTGIYPFESPGGWNIIGRTELSLFDVDANPPSLLSNFSQLRF